MITDVKHIMLIDDNNIDNFILRKYLDKNGFLGQISVYTSGKEALDYLNSHKNDVNAIPDLIVLDINMPVVDGFLFLYEFEDLPETIKSKTKITVVSSTMEKRIINRILKNGYVTSFLSKPINEKDVKLLLEGKLDTATVKSR